MSNKIKWDFLPPSQKFNHMYTISRAKRRSTSMTNTTTSFAVSRSIFWGFTLISIQRMNTHCSKLIFTGNDEVDNYNLNPIIHYYQEKKAQENNPIWILRKRKPTNNSQPGASPCSSLQRFSFSSKSFTAFSFRICFPLILSQLFLSSSSSNFYFMQATRPCHIHIAHQVGSISLSCLPFAPSLRRRANGVTILIICFI